MANDLNNGADKLVERILQDARADAETTAKQADAEIERIKELADHDVDAARDEAEARAKHTANGILERSRTNAELDSRKYALSAKRAVVEEAFAAAFERMCAMAGDERDALLLAAAVGEAAGGETVAAAPADVENMRRLLSGINEKLAATGRKALVRVESAAGIQGGFLLKGDGFEKNCSFEAMLRDVREACESEVAKKLFG